ncbi:MAG: phosphotransferase [Thermomicrobiales bacterium]
MLAPGSEAVVAASERLLPGGKPDSIGNRSWLATVTTDAGRFSVRQLDPAIPAVRVELIQEFLLQPELQNATRLVASDRIGPLAFDARSWALGSACGEAIVDGQWATIHLPSSLDLEQLGSIAAALAVFHQSGMNGSILARVPHLKLKDALSAARRSLDLDERRLAGEIRKESRARRWLSSARPLLANAEHAIEQADFLRSEQPVIAHQDLWGAHIVSEPDGGYAFLDCSRIGAAPVATDLAQLIGRNGAWSDDRVEQVLTGYADARPISPVQRRILPWLVALDAIPSCGRLLVRAHDERRPLSDADRRTVLQGADLQLELLARLAAEFVPPPPRQRRRPGRHTGLAQD